MPLIKLTPLCKTVQCKIYNQQLYLYVINNIQRKKMYTYIFEQQKLAWYSGNLCGNEQKSDVIQFYTKDIQ